MATPFIRFPGGAGNNVFTEDINLGDADQMHLQQSIGGWKSYARAKSLAQVASVDPLFGEFALQWAVQTSGTFVQVGTAEGLSAVPVSASTDYSASFYIQGPITTGQWSCTFRWFDSGGASLGVDTIGSGAVLESGWNLRTVTGVSPATAAFVSIYARGASGDFFLDDVYQLKQAVVRQGTDSSFVPSLRIVGSSFVSEEASVTPVLYTYSTGNPLVVGETYAGDVQQWALHDGADAAAPIVGQVLATDALRALPL